MLLDRDLLNCRGIGRAGGQCLLPLDDRGGSVGRLFGMLGGGVEEQGNEGRAAATSAAAINIKTSL